ncbi:MAG: DUF885 domain-containing protein, partial [bacterium]|nr:DUF885 domain-containing protein [bacterium]
MPTQFEKKTERYFDEYYEMEPLTATFLGIHEYDDRWGDLSPDGIAEQLHFADEWRKEFAKFDGKLSGPEKTDRALIESGLSQSVIQLSHLKITERSPIIPPSYIIHGCFIMFVRNYAPLEQRAEMILKRLQKAPAFLEGAKRTLKKPTPKFTEIALNQIEGGSAFVSQVLPQVLAETKYGDDIAKAAETAAQAIVDYGEYARDLEPGPAFPVGKNIFNAMLKDIQLLDYDTDSLLAFGEEMFESISAEMTALAEKIEPGAGYKKILDELKNEHPDADNLLDFYREWMDKTHQFVIDKDLVTLPKDEVLEIIETPAFERSTIPYGAYMPPAPFEKEQRGFFYVTPVDEDLTDEEKREKLKGHNNRKVIIVALHEGYPGHHLQLSKANAHPRKIRRLGDSTVFIEGWALYCEEMMREQGLYDDDKTVLSQKQDKLWRAARVIVDVSLQTGKMSFDEAVRFMVDKVGLMK